MKTQIWVILCDYRDPSQEIEHQTMMVDMMVKDLSNLTITTIAEEAERTLADARAIHTNFFKVIGVSDPLLRLFTIPPPLTQAGRIQLKSILADQVTSPIMEKDYELLFDKLDQIRSSK